MRFLHRIALGFEHIGDGRHPIGNAVRVAGHAYGQETGAERLLAQDEGGASGGAAPRLSAIV